MVSMQWKEKERLILEGNNKNKGPEIIRGIINDIF